METEAFRFLNPLWLLSLPALWGMAWVFHRYSRRRSMWSEVCDPRLLDHMRHREDGAPGGVSLLRPLVIVLTLAALAAAGPGWRPQSHPVLESANARIVVLDVSRAMLVEDVRPNRFTQAVAAATEIIDADFEGETGIIVFSGAAFILAPLSKDTGTLLAFIDALEPGILPVDGKRVDLAISLARDLLKASVFGRGQIVIITSGVERGSSAVRAALAAGNEGHRVSVMAIGTRAGGPLIDDSGNLLRDAQGEYLLARTPIENLEAIASAGQGVLVSLTRSSRSNELLEPRIAAANLVESGLDGDDSTPATANEGFWLLWLMLPFALLLFRKNLLWVILLAVLLPAGDETLAAETDSFWQHRERLAFAAYRRGDFELSLDLSRDPMLMGSASYRIGQYARALEYFSQTESARALYNRGNSFAMLQRFPDAIAAYGRALEIEPEHDQAKYNKRLIEFYLERQQQGDEDAQSGLENETDALEALDESGIDRGSGVVGQSIGNPGDEPQPGTGTGASAQNGQVDRIEEFDGNEMQAERFTLGNDIEQARTQMLVERWLKSLPTTSSDLFRRKFLRDYQRQRRQPR